MRAVRAILFLVGLVLAHAIAWSLHAALHTRVLAYHTQLSPDGELLARDSADGVILLRRGSGVDLPLRRWVGELYRLALDFSDAPSGSPPRTIIAWREDGSIWTARAEKEFLDAVTRVQTDLTGPYRPRLSFDGSRVAVPFPGGTLAAFDTADGAEVWRSTIPGSDIDDCAWSSDGAILAVVYQDQVAKQTRIGIVDASTGGLIGTIDPGVWEICRFFEFMPGTRTLITSLTRNRRNHAPADHVLAFDLLDPAEPAEITLRVPGLVDSSVLSQRGGLLAFQSQGGPVVEFRICRLESGSLHDVTTVRFNHKSYWSSVAFGRDGSSLLVAHGTGAVESFDLAAGTLRVETTRYRDPMFSTRQLLLFAACVAWIGCWIALEMRWMRGKRPGPREGWATTLAAAAIAFVAGLLAHLHALALNSPGADPISSTFLGMVALGLFGAAMLGFGIIKRRPGAALFAMLGVASYAAVYANTLVEIIASV